MDDRGAAPDERILFVCDGNTCRSPLAAAVARAAGIAAGSAGLYAVAGSPATPEARSVAAERGLDLSDHRSQPATPGLLAAARRVYVMTAEQLAVAEALAPDAEVTPLDPGGDIDDPYGRPITVYRATLERIARCVADRLA